jgi:hypothetical protein
VTHLDLCFLCSVSDEHRFDGSGALIATAGKSGVIVVDGFGFW